MNQNNNSLSIGRVLLIGALVFVGYNLLHYAPMVPKTIQFMDDVHALRAKATEYEKVVKDIQDTIARLEKKFSFFEQEQKKKR